jgi:hypothetical protein
MLRLLGVERLCDTGIAEGITAMFSHLQRNPELTNPVFADSDLEGVARRLIEGTIDARRDHVDVTVEGGWATVRGAVATAGCRCDVERHVRSLAGVNGLTNQIALLSAEDVAARNDPFLRP